MDIRNYVPVLSYTDETGSRTLPLTRDEITLGRSPQSDLLCTEPFVSRQHATIVRSASGFEVIDQNSTHGTFVNGKRLQRAFLQPDDVVQLGSLRAPRLHFVLQARADPAKATPLSPNDLLQTLTGMRPSPMTMAALQPAASSSSTSCSRRRAPSTPAVLGRTSCARSCSSRFSSRVWSGALSFWRRKGR